MNNRFDLPFLGYGIGLRAQHYPYILEERPELDWFEIISENYMGTDGRPRRVLEQIAERYRIVMHGVSMSIGTTDPQNSEYLRQLKKLADEIDTPWVSDHLCWTGIAHSSTHELLPVPYTEEALAHITDRVKRVQDYLGRPLLLENPSTYLEFQSSQMPEWEFIARLADAGDCGLLVDVNNIYVSCFNHRLDPKEYIDTLPADRVIQVHLAGHNNKGTHIVDTHDREVVDEVWTLYRYLISRTGEVSTLVEWDGNIPEFEVVKAEVEKARIAAGKGETPNHLPSLAIPREHTHNDNFATCSQALGTLQEAILDREAEGADTASWVRAKPDFSGDDQLSVYRTGYRMRLLGVLEDDLPGLKAYLGEEKLGELLSAYIEDFPPQSWALNRYIDRLPAFVETAELLEGEERRVAHDIARLETEITMIFHATETPPLAQEVVAELDPGVLLSSKLRLRVALACLAFDYDINPFYDAVIEEQSDAEIQAARPTKPTATWLAVFRHEDRVWRLDLEESEFHLLELLREGHEVGAAIGILLERGVITEAELSDKLKDWFARWMNNGLLSEIVNAA